MNEKNLRQIEIEEIELREDDEANAAVEGIGIVYDREQEIWPGYFETIRSGAFDKSLNGDREIKSFFNHNANFVLSTTRSKPRARLVLTDTEKGLRFRSPIPDTSYGRDLRENLSRGNVRGASFSFTVARDGDIVTIDEKNNYHREITKGTLYEIGPVTNPAYKSTKVGLRTAEDAFNECKEKHEAETREAEAKAQKERAEAEHAARKRTLDLL